MDLPWSREEFYIIIGQKILQFDTFDGAWFVALIALLDGGAVDVHGCCAFVIKCFEYS